jgi:hypothetical protein
VGICCEAEATRASVDVRRRKYGLKVLALVFGYTGIGETANLGVFPQNPE